MGISESLYLRQLELVARCVSLALANAPTIEAATNETIRESDSATMLAIAGTLAFFIEMVRGCLILLRERRWPSIFAVSRAPLLALVDLHNLKSDPQYPLHMDRRRLSEWTRFLDNAQQHANPLLAPMAEEYDIAEEAERMRAFGAETSEAGGQGLSDAERLRKAGFEHEYRAVYWLWSLYAHANYGAMLGAHVTQEPRFTFQAKDDLRELVTAADGLTGMTIGALYAAFPEFGIDTAPLGELRRSLSAIRAELGLNDGQNEAAAVTG